MSARKLLSSLINEGKARCWQELIKDVNRDPLGLGYKLVMRKLGSLQAPCILEAEKLDGIVRALFPTHPLRQEAVTEEVQLDGPPFIVEELDAVMATMKKRKAAGPDGIPAELLQMLHQHAPNLLLHVFNSCLKEPDGPACSG